MLTAVRQKKLRRLKAGGKLRVLDLFSGCGGLSLGFDAAGFEIVGAVESDPIAALSHALNFHEGPNQKIHGTSRDIARTDPDTLIAELRLGNKESAIDIVIGGPPCQAFARVGRAKLREIASHPEAFLKDPRSNLYLSYLRYVEELQPVVLVMENVPDVLNYGGHNIAEEMCETLTLLGYVCGYTLLNAAYYGVPQMRERMFLIAYAKELDVQVTFPKPTHWVDLPKGYEGSRQVALKHLQAELFNRFYTNPPKSSEKLVRAVTAKEAIADLPPITLHLEGKLKRGARRFNQKAAYASNTKPSGYAKVLRNWKGFESNGGINDHVIRSLPRDYPIFRRMNAGDQYPEAHKHALSLLKERIDELQKKGAKIKPESKSYDALRKSIVPPYDPGKFPNKWRKMEADRPARTLMAHLGKDSYSHIHYDSDQARTISVREAARLQSFPDGFVFAGTMNPAFRQIGNAVPPLLAKAIADEIMKRIRR